MTFISTAIALILTATAIVHIAWGFGALWPAKDKQTLINTVIGGKGMTQMPGFWLTMSVAAGIGAAGIFALWGAQVITLPLPEWMRLTSLIVLTAIFLLRGISCYLPFGPLQNSVEPFRTLDKRYYSPLILMIGAGYLAILLTL